MTSYSAQLVDFIENRIDVIMERPSLWGTLENVEGALLILIQLREYVLKNEGVMERYREFCRSLCPDTPSTLLLQRLRHLDKQSEFIPAWSKFISDERKRS